MEYIISIQIYIRNTYSKQIFKLANKLIDYFTIHLH